MDGTVVASPAEARARRSRRRRVSRGPSRQAWVARESAEYETYLGAMASDDPQLIQRVKRDWASSRRRPVRMPRRRRS